MDSNNQNNYIQTTYSSQTLQKQQLSFPISHGNSSNTTSYTPTYMQPVTTYYQQPFTQITNQTVPVIEKIIREKDTALEDKVALLTTELQRLQSQLTMKTDELSEMTNKYHQLYQTIDQKQTSDNSIKVILNENKKIREEIETWKKRFFQNHNLSYISYMQFEENYQHLDKLRKEEERQKLIYSAENEKLKLENNQIQDKLFRQENQLSQLKFQFNQETISKISEYEQTILIKTQQIEEYQKKISSMEYQLKDNSKQSLLQNNFLLITVENDRIHKILRQVLQENDHERENCAILMQKIEIYEQQLKDITQYENQIVLLQTEIQRLQSELAEKNQLFEQQLNEYNNTIFSKISLILFKKKVKEKIITELKNSEYQLDYKTNQKISDLENKIVTLTTEIERLQELRISSDQQSRKDEQTWQIQISDKDKKIYQLEEKLSQLVTELERIKGILDEKIKEQTNAQFNLQTYTLKIQELTSSHSRIEQSNTELLNQLSNYQQKNQNLEETILDLEEKIAKLSTEFERQQGIRSNLDLNQKEQIDKLSSENKKLQEKIIIYEQKCTHLSNEILRLQQQNSTYSDENSQLEQKMQSISQELLKLETLFNQSQTELDKFKKYASTQQQTIFELEENNKKLKEQLNHHTSQLTMHEETITTYTTTITEREQQILMLQEQLTLLLNEFKSLEAEYQATVSYLQKYQQKQMSFEVESEKYQIILGVFVLVCAEVEALRFRINSLLDDNAQVRKSLVKQAEIVKQSQFIPRQSTTQYETVKIEKQSQF